MEMGKISILKFFIKTIGSSGKHDDHHLNIDCPSIHDTDIQRQRHQENPKSVEGCSAVLRIGGTIRDQVAATWTVIGARNLQRNRYWIATGTLDQRIHEQRPSSASL